MRFKKLKYLFLLILIALTIKSTPQVFHKNSGSSKTIGEVNNGSIDNAWLIPRKGENYKYFSWFDYYVVGRAYTHSNVCKAVVNTYTELEKTNPEFKFRYMECAKKKGGKAWPHRTHQNGLSIDFMTPLKKNGKQKLTYDRIGMFRYLMNFDKNGKANINNKVSIDFDNMALHILTLEKNARKYNLKIRKVILNTHLQDELFSSRYGKQLRESGIYFTKNLTPMLNKLHDDHYHVDFERL
jgi:penicillin-insensitive murein DD-endopeptidase